MQNSVKNTTFFNLFELIAPHSCRGCNALGKPLCNCCKKYIINHSQNYCPNCKIKNPTGKCQKCKKLPPTFIIDERDNLIGKLIHDFKFNSCRALATPLAEIMHQVLPQIPGKISVVPLPTIPKHIRSRSFDHTYKIAKIFTKLRGKNYKIEKLLVRAKNTVQVGSDEKTREFQAKKAYKIAKNIKIKKETTYLLFDDVWTTGASMKSAIKKLQQAGVSKIIVAILAVNRLN